MKHRGLALVVLLVGVAMLLSPLVLYGFHPRHYSVDTAQPGFDTAPEGASVVTFENLSATEQRAVDPDPDVAADGVSFSGQPPTGLRSVFDPTAWQRADGLRTHDYVRYEGAYYRIRVDPFVATPRTYLAGVILLFGLPLGATSAVVGALMLATGSVRPLSPARSAWLPLAVGVVSLLLEWFSTLTFEGGRVAEGFPRDGLFLGAAAFVVVGAALARSDRWWSIGGVVCIATLIGYKSIQDPFPWWEVAIGITGFGALPLLAGILLTSDRELVAGDSG